MVGRHLQLHVVAPLAVVAVALLFRLLRGTSLLSLLLLRLLRVAPLLSLFLQSQNYERNLSEFVVPLIVTVVYTDPLLCMYRTEL